MDLNNPLRNLEASFHGVDVVYKHGEDFQRLYCSECTQWRSKEGAIGAAKFYFHLKIWKGEKYFQGKKSLWWGKKDAEGRDNFWMEKKIQAPKICGINIRKSRRGRQI